LGFSQRALKEQTDVSFDYRTAKGTEGKIVGIRFFIFKSVLKSGTTSQNAVNLKLRHDWQSCLQTAEKGKQDDRRALGKGCATSAALREEACELDKERLINRRIPP
jgi:hypothetical protein